MFSFLYFFVSVYLVLWNFVACKDLCTYHHNQDTEQIQHHSVSCLALHTHTLLLTLGNHRSRLHLYNLIMLRLLYRWNNTGGIFFEDSPILLRYIYGSYIHDHIHIFTWYNLVSDFIRAFLSSIWSKTLETALGIKLPECVLKGESFPHR